MPVENVPERKYGNRLLEKQGENDVLSLEDEKDFSEDSIEEGYGSSGYENKQDRRDFIDSLGSLDAAGAVKKLESLKKDPSLQLSVDDKNQISILIGKLSKVTGKIPAGLLDDLKKFEAKIFGNMDLEAEEFSGEDESDSAYLQADLDKTKKMIQGNPHLTKEEKEPFLKNIDKWSLDLGSMDPNLIQEQLDGMKEELSQIQAFPKSVRELAKLSGKEPSEIQALLKKHNLDSEHLPNPPDDKVAALLNDPEFSEKLLALGEGVATASKDLTDEIAKQTKTANDLNAEAVKDKNKERSTDASSYEFLYKANFHHDDKSTALISARQQVAQEAASYLSALYEKEVKVETDPKKAGAVSFEGQSLNVIGSAVSNQNGSTTGIKFSSTCNIDWPKVELVSFGVDNYGDGKTQIPQWMRDAHYPLHLYDTYDDHSTSLWWNLLGGLSWIANAVEADKKGDDLPAAAELKDIEITSTTPTSSSENKTGAEGAAKGYW